MKNTYIEHIEIVRGLSYTTIKNYDRWLATIERSIAPKPLERITHDDIASFIASARKAGLSSKTINLHIVVLRSFLKFCANKTRTIIPSSIEGVRFSEKKLEIPDADEQHKLFRAELPARHKALIDLLFSTGLRISELKSVKIEQVNWKDSSITVIGKGNKVRLVFLSEKAASSLRTMIGSRAQGHLFKETVRTLQRLVAEAGEMAGLKKAITPHMIRHVFATDLLESGASIYDAKKLLGHSSITTTERYLHVSDTHLKETFKKYHNKK